MMKSLMKLKLKFRSLGQNTKAKQSRIMQELEESPQ
jgi:hypothetical protein